MVARAGVHVAEVAEAGAAASRRASFDQPLLHTGQARVAPVDERARVSKGAQLPRGIGNALETGVGGIAPAAYGAVVERGLAGRQANAELLARGGLLPRRAAGRVVLRPHAVVDAHALLGLGVDVPAERTLLAGVLSRHTAAKGTAALPDLVGERVDRHALGRVPRGAAVVRPDVALLAERTVLVVQRALVVGEPAVGVGDEAQRGAWAVVIVVGGGRGRRRGRRGWGGDRRAGLNLAGFGVVHGLHGVGAAWVTAHTEQQKCCESYTTTITQHDR